MWDVYGGDDAARARPDERKSDSVSLGAAGLLPLADHGPAVALLPLHGAVLERAAGAVPRVERSDRDAAATARHSGRAIPYGVVPSYAAAQVPGQGWREGVSVVVSVVRGRYVTV